MESINSILDRIGEIRARSSAPPIPGRFQAMLEQQLDRSQSTTPGSVPLAAAPAQEGFAPLGQADTFHAMSTTTLGAMLGIGAGPLEGGFSLGAPGHLELSGIEARNGRLAPGELVSVGGGWQGRSARLLPPAAEAWETMRAAAASEGVDLYAIDTYRSWETQHRAHQAYLRGDKPANVLPAGHSQHGLGLAVDLTNGSLIGPGDIEWRWMRDNGRRFGWHPISNESWHWEYRGHH